MALIGNAGLPVNFAQLLGQADDTGFVALEMEDKENPGVAVPKSIGTLRRAFGP